MLHNSKALASADSWRTFSNPNLIFMYIQYIIFILLSYIYQDAESTVFTPVFSISPECASALMQIEARREDVDVMPLNAAVYAGLRHTMRLKATHFSTRIEGNQLSIEDVAKLIEAGVREGKNRDEKEVLGYYAALDRIDKWVDNSDAFSESQIQILHGICYRNRTEPTPYRDGGCVIGGRDGITYMPPEAEDVPALMTDLVEWIHTTLRERQLPVPVIAGIAHYQFVTIHPYFDGNGRTGRLLTTLILHQNGYGMQGIYNLEEHYVDALYAYYGALMVGPSHNYYLGRAEADITEWVTYFCTGMASACEALRRQIEVAQREGRADQRQLLRTLSHAQRRVVSLFADQADVTSQDIGNVLGVKRQRANQLCRQWCEEGFLVMTDESRRSRRYRLAVAYESQLT